MRQTELNLGEEDRSVIKEIRTGGPNQPREVNRALLLRLERPMLRLLQPSQDVAEGTTGLAQKGAPSFTGN